MKNRAVVISLIICVIIAAAGLTYRFAVPADKESFNMQGIFRNRDQIVIDCLGDSITWGMYASSELEEDIANGDVYTGLDDGGQLFEDVGIYISSAYQSDPSYPEVLESDLNQKLAAAGSEKTVVTYNDGICGDWITRASYRRMSVEHPDIVVLLMSGNNYYFGFPVDGMFEINIKALQQRGCRIYLANYPLYPGATHYDAFASANKHIAEMAEKYDLPLIDLYTKFEELADDGSKDAVEDSTADVSKSAASDSAADVSKDAAVGSAADGSKSAAADSTADGEHFSRDELFSLDHIHLSEKAYELVGHYVADAIYRDLAEK